MTFSYKSININFFHFYKKVLISRMSTPTSYFDWELSFRKKRHFKSKISSIESEKAPLGIPSKIYNEFLEKWREKNL